MQNRFLVFGAVLLSSACLHTIECNAINVPVGDYSFEEGVVPVTDAVVDGPGGWAVAYGDGFADASFLAAPPLYPNQDGDYLGNIFVTDPGNFAALYQDTTIIKAGTYTFTLGVAHEPGAEPTAAPFIINFEATGFGGGTVLLDENSFSVGTANSSGLTDITVTLEIPSGHPEIGRNLRPVLLTTGSDAGSNSEDPRASYMMDDVRLFFEPETGGASQEIAVGQPSFDPLTWNRPSGTGANATVYRPTTQVFNSQVDDQLGVLTLRSQGGWGAAFWQDTVPIEEGTYELTVGVAHDPDFEPTSAPFQINFESVAANGAVTLIGENVFPLGSANSLDLTDLTASLEIPENLPNIGETLRLVILSVGQDSGSNPSAEDPHASYLLDNVRLEFTSANGPLFTADFDNSGAVDGLDLIGWENSYGIDTGADADGDGDSDGSDFLVWQNQFGSGASVSAVTVPEPTGLGIAVFGTLMVGIRRRLVS